MKNKYNLVVIGGGPAGIIAAGKAAENGVKVLLIEKNDRLGVKLLITGKGRCNITNAEGDLKTLINVYGNNGKFLYSALNELSNHDTVNFFENLGLKTKVERGNRVFPQSDKSMDVLKTLKDYLKENKVDIQLNSPVKKIVKQGNKIEKIILENGDEISADNFLIATGGKSYPGTGSSGDGYKWLQSLGHKIIKPEAVLVPIIMKEKFIADLEGLSLKNISISLWSNKKLAELFGEAVFTRKGMSGPVILNLSKKISELEIKKLSIKIDFKPALDLKTLDKRILDDFSKFKSKQFKNSLDMLLPKKMIPVIIKLSGIEPEKKVSDITKEERKMLLKLLKSFELTFDRLEGFDQAIVTAGGVDLKEVDPKSMKSRLIDNLYLAGEILDIDGPTGGYNLQVAWSTGHLAGNNKFI